MKLPKFFILVVFAVVLGSSFLVLRSSVKAACEVKDYANPDEYQRAIEECQKEIEVRTGAQNKNKEDLAALKKNLEKTQALIKSAEAKVVQLEGQIDQRENDLSFRQEILATVVRNYYKKSHQYSPLLLFLASHNAQDLIRELAYRRMATNEDKETIIDISQNLKKLTDDKEAVEKNKVWLTQTKNSINQQAEFLSQEIKKVEGYFSEVSGKIAQLSAMQQAILSEKQGTFQTTVGEVPLADDPASRPDYNPGFSPAFAVFSFGAPHFKGMSQYGAFGRAKAGQSAEEILRAYYGGGIEIREVDANAQIAVDGYGTYSLEEYAKRIYEMPASWGDEGGMEALKAQAVAARSYALARGGSICATEACQVFKPSPKGGNWERAVNETRAKVVYANGAPFSTWYASTSGGYQQSYSANGYATPGFWDTPSGRDGWTSQAWEKQAGSPWFYKAWYKSRAGDSCGRSHPWLTEEEMADILNAWAVMFDGAGGDSSRVTPLGSCWGGNPYRLSELQGVGGFKSVNGVSVTYSTNGITANVTFQTNKGSKTINGADFKKAFNLRAPGRISLKSGLFNVEKK